MITAVVSNSPLNCGFGHGRCSALRWTPRARAAANNARQPRCAPLAWSRLLAPLTPATQTPHSTILGATR